jgi:hypothetical protein
VAQIGSTVVTYLYGDVLALSQSVSVHERMGVDGYDLTKSGKRSPQFVLRAVVYTGAPDLFIASLQAERGEIVTVVDAFGSSFEHVLVEEVQQPRKRAVLYNGAATVRVEMHVTCRRMQS